MALPTLADSLEKSLQGFSAESTAIIQTAVNKLSPDFITQLETLFHSDADLSQAYTNIGVDSGQGAWGAEALEEGKRIFQKYRSQLQREVCHYQALIIYCENAAVIDVLSIAAIIAGGLLQTATLNIDVVSASLILSRRGIQTFCQEEWKTDEVND